MATTQQILEIVAKFKDSASGPMGAVAKQASAAEKSLAAMTQRLEFQARAADLAAKSLNSTQLAYDKNAAAIRKVESDLAKFTTAEERNSKEAKALTASLEKLNTTGDRLAQSVGRQQLAFDKSTAAIAKTRDEAAKMGNALNEQADKVSKSGTAFGGLNTKLVALGAGFLSLSAVAAKAKESFTLTAELDQNQRMLGTLLGSVQKGDAVYASASKFAKEYGYTQRDMGQAAQEAAGIFKQTTQSTEKTLEVLGRLGSLNAKEGISGATVAMKELISLDVTSIAERFNISKSAANEMKDAIAAGADPVVVLDQALNNMGVTSAVLTQRMEGPNGAILRMEQASESLTLSFGTLLTTMNAPEAMTWLAGKMNALAVGFEQLVTGISGSDMAMNQANQAALTAGASYEKYVAALTAAGIQQYALSEGAYAVAQSLMSQGMGAKEAADRARELNDSLKTIKENGDLDVATLDALTDRMLTVATTSPEAAAGVQELSNKMIEGDGNGLIYAAMLELVAVKAELKQDADYAAAEATFYGSEANAEAALIADEQAAAFENLTGMTWEQVEAQFQQSLQAEEATRFQEDLALAVDMSSNSAVHAAAASAYLSSQYGLEDDRVRQLIKDTVALNKARAGAMGDDLGSAVAGSLPVLAAKAPNYAEGGAYNRPKAPSRSGGGAGAGGGKSKESPEVKQKKKDQAEIDKIEQKTNDIVEKHLAKRADLEEKHAAKIKSINDKANADREAATKKLQDEQIQGRAGFYASLVGMDIADQQAAKARYEEHWRIRGELAAAGKEAEADAYMAAADEELQADLARNEAIKAAREELNAALAEGDADRVAQLQADIANLEYSDKLLDDAAAARLEELKNANDSIAEEQARALKEENDAFSEAGDKLKEDFDAAMGDVKDSYADMSESVRLIADAFIKAAADATAAVNSIPSASGGDGEGEGSGDGGGESAPDGSHAGGLARVPKDRYIAELHKGEEVLTADDPRNQNNPRGRRMAELDALASSAGRSTMPGVSPMMARVSAGQMGGTTNSSVSSSTTDARQYHFDMRGASGPIAAAESRLREIARQEFDKGNSRTGRSAVNKSRS